MNSNANRNVNLQRHAGNEEPIDEQVRESFAQDQMLDQGSSLLKRRRKEHTDQSPELLGGDSDSTWDDADGEAAGGGAESTTDENEIDDVGDAAGISYSDTEPLHTGDKLERREHDRWELDPASDPDFQERVKEEFHEPRAPKARGHGHPAKQEPNRDN